jgi:SPP1 gp7 family putative phage head morphogenesis protein
MADTLAADMTHTNQIAASVINGYLPEVYAVNHNYGTYEVEKDSRINTQYTMYDKQTVERLMRDNPDLLPRKAAVNVPKDELWNKKHINSAVMQGIIQGDPIDKISQRLAATVTDMSHTSAIRNARTMTTSAQNGGRIDSYKRAESMGIKILQVWMATLDSRTRHEHRQLDGQKRKVGEAFEVEGEKIFFPGDPAADPALVYNCRCTLVGEVEGVDYNLSDVSQRDNKLGDMNYEEWKEEKRRQKESEKPSYFKPIEIQPSERIPQEIINQVNKRFKELDNKYHAKVENVNELLVQNQFYWDRDYTNYVKYLQDEQGYTKRKAENRAKQALGERPEKVTILQGGEYNMEEHILSLNSNGVYGSSSFAEDIESKKRWREKNVERQAEGRKARHRGNVTDSFEGAFIHEYGHAIDATYNVHENPKFKELYRRYSESDVDMGVSLYATENELEFIAECFADSFMGEEQGEISKEFMKILEVIINGST